MDLFVLGLSRLVPILLLASLTLAGSRYIFDVLLPISRRLASWAFACVMLIGTAGTAPSALRGALLVGARWAGQHGRPALADSMFSEYDAWNGKRSDAMLREWAFARMNRGDWRGAEDILDLDRTTVTQITVLRGLCQYYANEPAAESTLRSVPNFSDAQLHVRDYLLARIAQRQGDLRNAFRLYGQSAAWRPEFFPSVYHGARLALIVHRPDLAARILQNFLDRYAWHVNDPDVRHLRDGIRSGVLPPDKEFRIVAL
jgi:hypothetical protein